MKTILFNIALVAILILSSCSSTQNIATKKQLNYRVTFTPSQQTHEVSNGLTLTVIPIDQNETDKETYEAASRDGSYSSESIQYWVNTVSSNQGNQKDKDVYITILEIFNDVDRLIDGNFFSPTIGQELKLQMIGKGNLGNGSEITSLKDSLGSYPDTYNPFKVNQRHLSVFKVIFVNKSDKIVNIKSEDFQITCSGEMLTPLKNNYFEKMLEGNSEKLKNVFRMNLPDNLSLVPQDSIIKFVAVPAINIDKGKVTVKLIIDSKVSAFEYDVTKSNVEKTYKYYQFVTKPDDGFNTNNRYFVVQQGQKVYSLSGNVINALSNNNNEPFSIYYASFERDHKKYGKKEMISPNDPNQNLVVPSWSFKDIEKKTLNYQSVAAKSNDEILIDKAKVALATNCKQIIYSTFQDVVIGDYVKYAPSLDEIYVGIISEKLDNNIVQINTYPRQGYLKVMKVKFSKLIKLDVKN